MAKKRSKMRPEERRNQILDCAQSLFFSNGYDVTTVNDIMKAAGLSKGGFYHHFASKDELLVGILERSVLQTEAIFQPILEIPGLAAIERYERYFKALRDRQTAATLHSQLPVVVALFRNENAMLRVRLIASVMDGAAPVFSQILRLGMDEGAFKIDNPDAIARLIIQIGNHHQEAMRKVVHAATKNDLEAAGLQLIEALKVESLATDRLLGIPDGTTRFRSDDFAPAFVEMVRKMNFPEHEYEQGA